MGKLNKNISEVISEIVIHTSSTKKSKKSSLRVVAKDKRVIETIYLKSITK